jgi:hypothetical protein
MFAIVFAALTSTAQAWEIKLDSRGDELAWQNTDIHYRINTDGAHDLNAEDIRLLVASAAREWDSVQGVDLMLEYNGESDIVEMAFEDGVNIIYFEDVWEYDEDLLAVTNVWSLPGGEIVGFDMAVNAEFYDWSTNGDADANDLLNTLVHEFGHAIGLDHSYLEEASMWAETDLGELSKRDLARDDIEGLMYLYPTQLGPDDESVLMSCSSVRAHTAGWMGFLALLPALVRRRTR